MLKTIGAVTAELDGHAVTLRRSEEGDVWIAIEPSDEHDLNDDGTPKINVWMVDALIHSADGRCAIVPAAPTPAPEPRPPAPDMEIVLGTIEAMLATRERDLREAAPNSVEHVRAIARVEELRSVLDWLAVLVRVECEEEETES